MVPSAAGQNDLGAQAQIAELTEDGDRRADIQVLAAPEIVGYLGHAEGRFEQNHRVWPTLIKRMEFPAQF